MIKSTVIIATLPELGEELEKLFLEENITPDEFTKNSKRYCFRFEDAEWNDSDEDVGKILYILKEADQKPWETHGYKLITKGNWTSEPNVMYHLSAYNSTPLRDIFSDINYDEQEKVDTRLEIWSRTIKETEKGFLWKAVCMNIIYDEIIVKQGEDPRLNELNTQQLVELADYILGKVYWDAEDYTDVIEVPLRKDVKIYKEQALTKYFTNNDM